MKTAFLFPGQGAQTAGMGRDVFEACPEAARLFEKANQIVGYNLMEVCFEGPEDKLNTTMVSQPAIFVTSAVILEAFRTNIRTAEIRPDVTAGLSLGEYTALYSAGNLGFEDALRLVQKRGSAMQAAAEKSRGGMVSIIGLDEEKVQELCDEASQGQILLPVNFNCPGQIVVSGDLDACNRVVGLAEKYGAIKAIQLKVAGAFHTEMMAPAANELQHALDDCPIAPAGEVKVIANISADYYNIPDEIRQGLVKQLVQPILWRKCMERLLAEGVECFYEIGPGRVLTGLMKRISRKTKVISISSIDAIQKLQGVIC
jgi:[acyl-carrier-protein] S-malonyltransferase